MAYKPLPGQPKRMRDWVGLRVRLLRDISTHGGADFPSDTEMKIQHVGGRGFVLVGDGEGTDRRWIRNVPASDLAIVGPVSPFVETRAITSRCRHLINPHVWQKTQFPSHCYHCGAELDEQTLAYLEPYDIRVKIEIPTYILVKYPIKQKRKK